MKKFLISLVLMWVVTVYTMDGKILTQPWIFINGDGVYLMTDTQAKAGSMNILEGATRILETNPNNTSNQAKEIHQNIKNVPRNWTNFIPHENVSFISRGNKK